MQRWPVNIWTRERSARLLPPPSSARGSTVRLCLGGEPWPRARSRGARVHASWAAADQDTHTHTHTHTPVVGGDRSRRRGTRRTASTSTSPTSQARPPSHPQHIHHRSVMFQSRRILAGSTGPSPSPLQSSFSAHAPQLQSSGTSSVTCPSYRLTASLPSGLIASACPSLRRHVLRDPMVLFPLLYAYMSLVACQSMPHSRF